MVPAASRTLKRRLYAALAASMAAASPSSPSVPDWVDVKAHGAVGDGKADDTRAFQEGVRAARKRRGVLYIPIGTYLLDSTLAVTEGEALGCRIEGANTGGAVLVSRLKGDAPLFSFRGGSGSFSNVGLRNLTLVADSALEGQGAAILLDGQGFAQFENLRIVRFKYGIWLHNRSAGSFTEANIFSRISLEYCGNGVRMEAGPAPAGISFHGNVFDGLFINVGARQIGFNHVSGYYYNGRFRMSLWAHSDASVYVNADGNAERNIGDITYESGDGKSSPFGAGRLTGRGRFWYSGPLQGIGPLVDETTVSGRDTCQKVFACDNWWAPKPYGSTGLMASAPRSHTSSYNGPTGFFQALRGPGMESVLFNTHDDGKSANGLYLGTTAFRCPEPQGRLGMFISADGKVIRSSAEEGLRLESKRLDLASGRIRVGAPAAETLSVRGSAQVEGDLVASGYWRSQDSQSVSRGKPLRLALERLLRLGAVEAREPGEGGSARDSARPAIPLPQVEREFPGLVRKGADGRKAIDYAGMAPILLEAIREQDALIRAQQRRLDSLIAVLKPASGR